MNYIAYPASEAFYSIADYINNNSNDINITELVIPIGWKHILKKNCDIPFSVDFNISLEKTDGVIICDCSNFNWLYKDILKKINSALSAGKKVLCCTELEEIDKLFFSENDNFIYHDNSSKKIYSNPVFDNPEAIIIGIGKVLNGVDSSKSFYEMLSGFKKVGYTVVGIGADYNSWLADCYPFPEYIFSSEYSDDEKVLQLNFFLNFLQTKHCADIILIQFPTSTEKFNNNLGEGFGIKSYIISQAVNFDYFVLNTAVDLIKADDFEKLSTKYKHKYGFIIDAVVIENKSVDISYSIEMNRVSYNFLYNNEADELTRKCINANERIKFYSSTDSSLSEKIVSDCIKELAGDVEAM